MIKTLNIICLMFNYGFGACMFVTAIAPVVFGLLSGAFGCLATKLKWCRLSRW
jgi:hypothetical protein